MLRLLSILLLIGIASAAFAEKDIPIDGYAALVNDRVITMGEVYSFMAPARHQLEETYSGKELEEKAEEAYQTNLTCLIEKALILEDYSNKRLSIPERAIDEQINNIIHDRFDNSRIIFLEALARERITLSDWRNQIRDQLVLMVARRQEVTVRVSVSPSQIIDRYQRDIAKYSVPEEVWLRAVVLHKGLTDGENKSKRNQMETILNRIRGGADFAEIARELSEGPKANNGGDWGWTETNDLRNELAAACTKLQSGDVSDIIENDEAFYVIKLEGRKSPTLTPLAEVRNDIKEELRQEQEEQLYHEWVKRLEQKHYIKRF